jgi:glycosyltransferase involved in cell wall biosynthesis
MKGNNIKSVALLPDRFASYRYTIFKRLSDFKENGFYLTIYADTEEDVPGLKLVDASYCDRDYLNGGISWVRIKNIAIRGICFWQTGLFRLACSKEHDVHVYWGEAHRLSTWISAVFSRILGKQVVFWGHGIYGNEGRLKGWVRRSFYRLSNVLLVYSDYGKDLLVERGFASNRIYVIKNSLDCQKQNEFFFKKKSRAELAKLELFSEQDRVLIFIGRLEPQKRLQMLLEALVILNRGAEEHYKLLVIGAGSQRASLLQLAEGLNVSSDVVFYGACYDDEILAPLIMMADVCVSPGEVGLTAMHSLIYGTPVVTHDDFAEQMPEFEAICPGVSGAFYEHGDLGDLCAKIEQVIGLIDSGVINSNGCREIILKCYTKEYQVGVFNEMLEALI